MGRPNPALRILVHPQWGDHPLVRGLAEAGHDVAVMDDQPDGPDLILHPAAWRWHDALWKYLDVALAEARRQKRERVRRGQAS